MYPGCLNNPCITSVGVCWTRNLTQSIVSLLLHTNLVQVLTVNDEADVLRGCSSDPVVGLADVEAGVVAGYFRQGQGGAVGGQLLVGQLVVQTTPGNLGKDKVKITKSAKK